MKTVFKYPLQLTDRQTLDLPLNAAIMDIQLQDGRIYLWAAVNPEEATKGITFICRGTGQPLPENVGAFIATVQDSPYVWHFFLEA